MPAPGEGLEAVFRPDAVAVVGAAQHARKIVGKPVHFLRRYGVRGAVSRYAAARSTP